MRNMLRRLWHDDSGAVVSTEYVMVTGLAVGAAGSGVVAIRNAAIKQAEHLAETITSSPAPTPDEMRRMTALPVPSQQPTTAAVVVVVQQSIMLPPSP